MSELFSLEGKVAVITGGGGVLGGCVALSLANDGVKIVILDRRQEVVDAKVKEIKNAAG